jgi:hypothetical protein
LEASSLEAATIIGQAVGKDMFAHDAHQLLQWMMPRLQQQQQQSQDNGGGGGGSMTETMLLACARMASVLEDDFVPYVHVVVPLLLQRIQQEPDVSIVVSHCDPSLGHCCCLRDRRCCFLIGFLTRGFVFLGCVV